MSIAPEEWNVLSMLEWGTNYFSDQGIPDPRLSIEWILAKVLDIKRLDLYLQYDRPLTRSELDEIKPLIKRRTRHEPLQYITGYTDFMNVRLEITPDVLIPRLETEQLVEIILDRYDAKEQLNVLDIGTGSGCIPVALAAERPQWTISTIDISEKAVEIARENARRNDVDINFITGDLFEWEKLNLDFDFDLVVSNPPYVLPDEKEKLQKQVIEYEPEIALFTQNMDVMYQTIIECAEQVLKDGGSLYLEVHESHAGEISNLFDLSDWNLEIGKDYQKKDRYIVADKTS